MHRRMASSAYGKRLLRGGSFDNMLRGTSSHYRPLLRNDLQKNMAPTDPRKQRY